MATAPKDSADMRAQRIEETLGFLEHTVDALSKQYADLQADVSRAERRLRALEQAAHMRPPAGDSYEPGKSTECQ